MLSTIKNTSLVQHQYFIDGKWLKSASDFAVTNPANGEEIIRVSHCGTTETRQAIASADTAFQTWKKTTARSRSDLLMKWYALMLENADDLARLMTTEQGKPLAEAKGEVGYAASFLRWFAEEGVRTYGDVIPSHRVDARIIATRKPVGVVGIITPWNFPLAMITRKVAPALAAGCTCVIKPSEFTPLSANALVELAKQAGIPDGVINIIAGDAEAIGEELTSNNTVRKISFTGSTRVGKLLMEKSASNVKRLSLELGGNAPFIIFEDADLEIATNGVMASKYRNAGQTCVCANRIFVHENIMDKFSEMLTAKVNALQVGSGFESGVTQGPLINEAAVAKVESHIADAVSKGAKVIVGGQRHEKGGLFFQPTILANVSKNARVNEEETFGPVAPLISFSSEDEVVTMANDTEFGLSAYFCTQNIGRAWRVAEALEAGIVGINEGIISTEIAPFGGVKQSGLGREGSKYGIDEYLEIQYILMGLN